jgi:two-component system, OmpR family, phosphate regulon sensor histidine kinase PhoR
VRSSRKLRLAPLWPALAAVAVMALTLVVFLPPLFERSVGDQIDDSLRLVERAVAPALEAPPGDRQRALQERVTRLASGTSLRITVIAPDGRVLADSDRTWNEMRAMENHAGRTEVRAALSAGSGRATRRSASTGRRYVYAARAFRTGAAAGGELRVLRLAQPLDDLARVRNRLAGAMALGLLASFVVIALLSVRLDRRLLRPLAALIDGAGALAAGRRGRLPVPEQRDLADLATAVNRMTDRVEEQIAAVEKERDHLRTILASMSEGVLVVDRDGRAVLANPAFRRLFGLPDDVEGRLPLELTRRPELAALIRRTLDEGEARVDEVVVEDVHGGGHELRTVALAGAALRTLPAEGGGGVVVARDTSETSRLIQMRRDFVANVSHELKTPLSAIRGFAETLRDGALGEPDTALRFTERILDQCRRLQEMLDDLLILSRLESVEIPLEARPVDLVRLADRCLETIAPYARERGIGLVRGEPAGDLPPLTGDRGALGRLLLNLLENAVKYNREGGEVRLRVARGEAGGVLIEVADTGIGIPQAALPRIFERFYRVDKGRARGEGGTGLGLAIVKHVAQAHGGRVEVESRHRHGSTFRVVLPAGAAPERAAL